MRLLLLISLLCASYQNSFGLWAYMNSYQFHLPGESPYVEVVISIDGKTIDYKEIGADQYQSSVELIMVVYQDNQVVLFKKSVLESEILASGAFSDLMTLERFIIPNGSYTFEITIKDLISVAQDTETQASQWTIANPESTVFVSSAQFIGAYTPTTEVNAFSKSGFDIVPLVSSHFESGTSTLMFYQEIYNSDKAFGVEGTFVSNVYVANGDGTPHEDTRRIKREKGGTVIPSIQQMDISKLPSGDYLLITEIRDKKNEIIYTRSTHFSRTLIPSSLRIEPSTDEVASSFAASYKDVDTLRAVIESHLPIANTQERNTIDHVVATATLEQLQSFLYSFWLSHAPQGPEAAFRAYAKEVRAAQVEFGSRIRKGWQTDRGRVYLQYGRPNTRVQRPHSTDYFPFEIWHYYETNDANNLKLHDRRFLFYNPSLSGDYELLHSDVPGEVQNQDWKMLARTRGMDTPANTSQRQNEQRDTRSGDELEELFYNPH